MVHWLELLVSYYGISKLTIAKMAGVEENDIDRLLVNPQEKVEIEVKYKIDVTVMGRINYHRRSEFTEKISHRRKITIVLMNLLHLPTSAYSRPNIIVHIQVVHQ